ncbi:bifunctional phosphoribosylaminoimidazolecarboxamide formyltransferase/IMP cyclohydrolase PurH [Buchananella hordeovulneris]|uniref:bifunctional phosphoribosylaminoimidazolecarboxamide formyltransferase/IMP cyclohydrolase n=1 Tax=Buchananella hordeovulneris TaxID=52770 RepID=UPI000F5D65D1|nr:bifunctional phosphoribosylaminoimidazolecarboxamide formyltransferase/IMP cyclohydrolase [Buchananella hordeovulneris]RRD52861.1 bifunctional phosphoribosylaminoimidazolecarboxamide formyltransferase/IMP cyclohydrolase PurH [Buchananella hordeovulneris]
MSATASPTLAVLPVRRALLSVYDKTGIVEFAQQLAAAGVELVSTGSTAALVAAAGVPVTPVEQVTGFPECLEGRVKTLHPAIHAGILADRRKPDHLAQLSDLDIAAFDLVVVNLYPFAATIAAGADFDACVEQIDIGGPTMVRAAAKNHPSVAVVVDPTAYPRALAAVASGGFTLAERRELALAAFTHTAQYDATVATYLAQQLAEQPGELPPVVAGMERRAPLRYGENPHQAAALYHDGTGGIAAAEQLHGKEMSFNNYGDTDAAVRAAYDHAEPCVAIVKHANPCGLAIGQTIAEAYAKAHACDPVSAFGGVIATNRPVSCDMARAVVEVFTEVVAAPHYEDGALEILQTKKNLRVLRLPAPPRGGLELKPISGGLLVQQRDELTALGDDPARWQLVAGPVADAATLRDLAFAWRAVRAVRSNAILLAADGATVGIGMGQVNRVDSCRLAVERANTLGTRVTGDAAAAAEVGGARATVGEQAPQRARGAVAASDAFFPFADGLQILLDAGVRAVVQPGGSVRDAEVIAAAAAAGVSLYLTGTRHFSH